MEFKQILGIIIACIGVCILIGILNTVPKTDTDTPEETLPAVSDTGIYMPTTTTDFWDVVESQQQAVYGTTETTTVPTDATGQEQTTMTDEKGNPIPVVSTDVTDGTGLTDQTTVVSDPTSNIATDSNATTTTTSTTYHPNIREDGYHIILTN